MHQQNIPCPYLIPALALLVACSGDSATEPTPPEPQPADLRSFFATMPDWTTFSPTLAYSDEPASEPTPTEPRTIDGSPYSCSTTNYSLTATPDDMVTMNPDVEVLWLGALLQGDGHLRGIGSLAELPIRQRAPVTLALDLLTGNNTRTVHDPSLSTVNQAIGELIQAASDAGHRSGSNVYYTSEITHSVTQAALKMGLSARYMSSTVKGSLGTDVSEDTRTITAYFVQRMFTASMVLPQQPERLFSDEFTEELLEREQSGGRMTSGNPPVYVSSVVYGRILMFSLTASTTESKVKTLLSVLYNGGEFGGDLDAEYRELLDRSTIRVVTVGGDANHAVDLIRENNLGAFFSSDAAITTARPISYTVRYARDNVIARVSESTEYSLQECTPVDTPITGARYRIIIDRVRADALPYPWTVLGRPADIIYNFHVTDPVQGQRTGAVWAGGLAQSYLIWEGESHTLQGKPVTALEVDLHFDGRDWMDIGGTLTDRYVALPAAPVPRTYTFYKRFKWPNAGIDGTGTAGTFHFAASDRFGNRFRLYVRWTKLEDLTD